MPVSAETLRALMAAGVVGDALLIVVEKIDADMLAAASMTKPRSSGAERQAKHRDKLREVTESDVTSLRDSDVTAPPNDRISNPPDPSLRSELVQACKLAIEEFRKAYPRKPGARWQQANEKLQRLMRDGQDPAPIIEGAKRFAASKVGVDPQYICDPTVFLNKRRWLDDHEPARPAVNGHHARGQPPPDQIRNPMIAAIQRRLTRAPNEPTDHHPDDHPAGVYEPSS